MTPESAAILLVEHDPELGRPLLEQLLADGYRASHALSAEHARALSRSLTPTAAILGALDMPRGALDLLEEIRGSSSGEAKLGAGPWREDPGTRSWRKDPCAEPRREESGAGPWREDPGTKPWREDLPAIVIGSSSHHLHLLRAFEAGADDYLARPLLYLELRARLGALLRRAHTRPESLTVGPLHLNLRSQIVTLHGRPVPLRRQEYLLLLHLAREPTRVFSRRELLREIWGYPTACSTRTLDTHASRLRRALAGDGHRWVLNVRGIGYRLI